MHLQVKRAQQAELRARVLLVADEVFERYVEGESFAAIARSLDFTVTPMQLRDILMTSDETHHSYRVANEHRSHHLIEQALDYSRDAAMSGEVSGLKVAIDTNIKIAGKLNPAYNDKSAVELTGKDGGPLKVLALTDEQLLEIAARGAQGDAE